MVAVFAPILAFISSDILAMELMSVDVKQRQSDRDHEQACELWEHDWNQWWGREQNKWGVRIQVEPQKQLVTPVSSETLQTLQALKPSPKLQIALNWFEDHHEDLSVESRKLSDKI